MECPICKSPVHPQSRLCGICGYVLQPQSSLPVGSKLLGRYSVGKVLGQGGFGVTYLGADLQHRRPVAVKELFPEGSARASNTIVTFANTQEFNSIKESFLKEAHTLSQFRNAGIVQIYDVLETNHTAYIVMEYLRGKTLADAIEQQKSLTVEQVYKVASNILDALIAVHAVDILHRDIKPENIFLHEDGRIVLLDFGSARQFTKNKTIRHTRLLTPSYAPPEQYATQARFGAYTDLYALGATLYNALTGEKPPTATDRMLGDTLKPLPAHVPEPLKQLIQKCLMLKTSDRPQTSQEAKSILLGGTPSSIVQNLRNRFKF